MSITKTQTTKTVDGVTIRCRTEERTTRIQIETPVNPKGIGGFTAVAWREWAEYENDVLVRVTALPPLHIKITPNLLPILQGIACRIDMIAKEATDNNRWPKQGDELLKP